MKTLDVHKRRHRLKLVTQRIEASPDIQDDDRRLILEFRDHGFAEGLSVERVEHYLHILNKIAEWMKPRGVELRKARKEDLVELVGWVERRQISDWTKHDYRVALKKFYKWLNGGESYPPNVKWIKVLSKRSSRLPDELLSEGDVERLIDAARHPRDKALVAVLYESGCRIGELLTMRMKHAKFTEHGARLIVEGKTGMRRIIIVASSPHLAAWLNVHPMRDDPEAAMWVGIGTANQDKPLDYPSARKMVQSVARRAKVKKAVNPHLFRHSRATHLARHLTEAQMCEYFGWVQGSKMASTYVHLSGRDVDGAILKLYGLEDTAAGSEDSRLAPRKCPRCREMNPSGSKYCSRCSLPLDMEAVELEREVRGEVDRGMELLFSDPEFRDYVSRKLMELKPAQP